MTMTVDYEMLEAEFNLDTKLIIKHRKFYTN